MRRLIRLLMLSAAVYAVAFVAYFVKVTLEIPLLNPEPSGYVAEKGAVRKDGGSCVYIARTRSGMVRVMMPCYVGPAPVRVRINSYGDTAVGPIR